MRQLPSPVKPSSITAYTSISHETSCRFWCPFQLQEEAPGWCRPPASRRRRLRYGPVQATSARSWGVPAGSVVHPGASFLRDGPAWLDCPIYHPPQPIGNEGQSPESCCPVPITPGGREQGGRASRRTNSDLTGTGIRSAFALLANALFLLILLLLHSHVSTATADTSRCKKETYIIHMGGFHMPPKFEGHRHGTRPPCRPCPTRPRSSTPKAQSCKGSRPASWSGRPRPWRLGTGSSPCSQRSAHRRSSACSLRRPSSPRITRRPALSPESLIRRCDQRRATTTPCSDPCRPPVTARARKARTSLVGQLFFSKCCEANSSPIDETRAPLFLRDKDGQGTQASTTSARSVAPDASLFGFASGTAGGMARARWVAVYKVYWVGGSFTPDIVAALDKVVDNGELSLSLGGGQFGDGVAIMAIATMEKRVRASSPIGEAGPGTSTLSSVVDGSGMLDGDFPAYIVLANVNNHTDVQLLSGKPLESTARVPFIYAGIASNSSTRRPLCMTGTLIPEKVKGTMPLCNRGISARVQEGYVVKEAGGTGMVLANTIAGGEVHVADSHLLPSAGLGQMMGNAIKSYVFSIGQPTVTIVIGVTNVINSTLMTTTYISYIPLRRSNAASTGNVLGAGAGTGKAATAFDLGSGHVDPVRALDLAPVYYITSKSIWAATRGRRTPSQIPVLFLRECEGGKHDKSETQTVTNFGCFKFPVPDGL